MKNDKKIGITFQPTQIGTMASLSLDDLEETAENIDNLLKEATNIYTLAIENMKIILRKNKKLRSKNKEIPARLMWDLGDSIFKLVNDLKIKNFELESLYENLTRDLDTSEGTLKRVLSIRRCINQKESLPKDLNWGALKGAPRKYLKNYINEK